MSKHLGFGFIALLLFAGFSGLHFLRDCVNTLEDASHRLLNAPEQKGAYRNVTVRFEGQEARLSGSVGSEEDKTRAAEIIRNQVRIPGGLADGRNPVIEVYNDIAITASGLTQKASKPWLAIFLAGEKGQLLGETDLVENAEAVMSAVDLRLPLIATKNAVNPAPNAQPGEDWPATVEHVPAREALSKVGARGAFFVTACDGLWTPVDGAEATDAQVAILTQAGIDASRAKTIAREFAVWRDGHAEAARLAALPVARAGSVSAQPADNPSPAPAPALPLPSAATASALNPPPPPAPRATPAAVPSTAVAAYVGWTFMDGKVELFGTVPDDATKTGVIAAAKGNFEGSSIDTAGLKISAPPGSAPAKMVGFQKIPAPAHPLIGVATFDGTTKVYSAKAYDDEIARDFGSVPLKTETLGADLKQFREHLVSKDQIAREVPFASLLADGKTVRASGEIASNADKQLILSAIRQRSKGLQVIDNIKVTPLVFASGDVNPTIQSVPTFTAGKKGVATVRPGEKWRQAVVHAIYFQTGSDRSKDQQRALAQVREVLKVVPNAKFHVVGNTDNVGALDANVKLSTERAQKFADYLTAAHIPADIVSHFGAGRAQPIADNDTEPGRALNRRVDVVLH